LATEGRGFYGVNQLEWFTYGCREMSSDHLRSSLVEKGDIKCTYKVASLNCHLEKTKEEDEQ